MGQDLAGPEWHQSLENQSFRLIFGAMTPLRRRLFYPLNYGEGHVRDIACSRRDRDGKVDSAQSIANARRAGGANTIRSARSRQKLRLRNPASEIDNHEIFLAHIAQRASPVGGDIGETRAGGDAVVRQAFRFVVDPPANQADPALVFGYFAHVVLGRMKVADVVRGAASGREAQWYRNSAERPRNVVQACTSRTTSAVARPGRAVYAS